MFFTKRIGNNDGNSACNCCLRHGAVDNSALSFIQMYVLYIFLVYCSVEINSVIYELSCQGSGLESRHHLLITKKGRKQARFQMPQKPIYQVQSFGYFLKGHFIKFTTNIFR